MLGKRGGVPTTKPPVSNQALGEEGATNGGVLGTSSPTLCGGVLGTTWPTSAVLLGFPLIAFSLV